MIEYYKNLSLESLFYINEDGLVCQEEWRDIPNYVGKYKISTLSRIKSLKRKVFGGRVDYFIEEKIIKQHLSDEGRLVVGLSKNSLQKKVKTHQLMAIVFLNHIPCGFNVIVDHKNNNSLDNRLENIQLITQLENLRKDKKGVVGINNVYLENGRFRGRFWFKNKQYCVGYFETAEKAKETVDFVYEKLLKEEDVSKYIKVNKNKYHKNISIDNGKYRPRFTVNKKRINLPAFEKIEDAINCLNEAKKQLGITN